MVCDRIFILKKLDKIGSDKSYAPSRDNETIFVENKVSGKENNFSFKESCKEKFSIFLGKESGIVAILIAKEYNKILKFLKYMVSTGSEPNS
jgi:hypothetical protein